MIKLIIFDYDGVIVDSFPIYHQIYKKICEKFGKNWPPTIEEFRKIYGNNSNDCYRNLGFNEEQKLEATKIIKQELSNYEPKIFEGIEDTLKKLQGQYKLAVVSSSPHEEVERKLRKFGLNGLFDFVIGRPHHQLERFVKTEHLKKVAGDLGFTEDEVLLIGDRNVDFVEGSAAGLKNIILVDYGWGYSLKEIPDYKKLYLIKKPTDLLILLK